MTSNILNLFSALLLCAPESRAADDIKIKAEVHHVVMRRTDSQSPGVQGYLLTLDVRLTNVSAKPVEVPIVRSDEHQVDETQVVGAWARLPDGTYPSLLHGDFNDTDNIIHPSCMSLSPGQAVEYKNIHGYLFVPQRLQISLNRTQTIGLNLVTLCMDASRKVRHDLATELFTVHFPEQPR